MKFYHFFKALAFQIDAERAHSASIRLLSSCPHIFTQIFNNGVELDPRMKVKVGSMTWPFPVGLAAGLDKNAEAIDFFSQLLFGAIEVGTVTPKPQSGNPRPRMFRYKSEESLRNKMGFNNLGSEKILENVLSSHKNSKILGINLGKNKLTESENAPDDYRILYEKFHSACDYLVVNVSSPNTPGLRDLQRSESLKEIFTSLEDLRKENPRPLYLKISPDISFDDIDSILEVAHEFNLEGIIATNTTIMKDRGDGGISGKLLSERARGMRKEFLSRLKANGSGLEFIGVGGISSFEDVWEFWKLGGRGVQIYTSFIYQGPEILHNIQRRVLEIMNKNNIENLEDLLLNINSLRS